MATGDVTKKVISKRAKGYKRSDSVVVYGLAQVVHKTEIGKNKKGKTVYLSRTQHERI